jgi:cytochrome d ubiquinol oxidase subunit II
MRALVGGVVTGAIALGGLFVLRDDARDLYDGLTSGAGLALVLASGVFGAVTLALVAARHYETARWTSAAAVACVTFGWAAAQSPYLLPGKLTLEQGAAPHSTLVALLISLAGGALVLIPSLVLLYRLVLRGHLDQEFEPIDQGYEEPV